MQAEDQEIAKFDDFLKYVDEDLKTMEPGSKTLQTQIFMMQLYYKKLPQNMQVNLMELVTLIKAVEKRYMEQYYLQKSGFISLSHNQVEDFL